MIQPDAVLRAEDVFSTWKREHLVSENMYILPELDDFLELFRGKPQILPASTLESMVTDYLLKHLSDSSGPRWLSGVDEPIELVSLLYALEVIGVERIGSKPKDKAALWDRYEFCFQRPKAKIETSPTLLFHPGLWRVLELQ
jgi:hypothetical protein